MSETSGRVAITSNASDALEVLTRQTPALDNVAQRITMLNVSPRRIAAFRMDEDLLEELGKIRDEEGIPVPEQVRRAVRMWLDWKRGQKADRKRVSPRKRP